MFTSSLIRFVGRMTPAMTNGPIIGPLPASSTPATSGIGLLKRPCVSEVKSSDCDCSDMKSVRVFLTGEPGVGKTTIILKVVQELQSRGIMVGGMTSGEIRMGGSRVGFQVEDISTREVGELAKLGQTFPGAPRVGRYGVNLADVERVGVAAIRRALKVANVVIVDEIGPMELKSPQFVHAMEDALASTKNLLGTLHRRTIHPLTNAIRTNSDYQVIEVTVANRDRIEPQVTTLFGC